jgi:hypothetical protein
MGDHSSEDCLNLMSSFRNLCYELNIPIAEDKTVGPVTVLTFLGFVIDTAKMIVVIPEDKIIKQKDYLVPMLNSKKISVKDLIPHENEVI